MAKFDTEDLLDSVLGIMKNNGALNTKIAAIEAEKAALGRTLTPGLLPVQDKSYHEQTWSNKILNTNPAIFYGIEDVTSVENADTLAKTYRIFIDIVMVDNGQKNDVNRRINRYSRALEELFQAALKADVPGRVKVETVRPFAFKLEMNTNDEIKVGGISLTITLV